ncbi:unnamed protein product [Schistosoma rodhaini]|uniref:Protein SERAC1 n=1 Tax=Schistosoma rodhaini TaxID=6188 RepID=A0AA85FXY9_9TREM|nr:unnamed protein product [Schistosoma rodhaini]
MWTPMSTYIFISDLGSFTQICLFVKATSTLCIIWSAYVFAKARLFSRRDSDIHNTIDNKKRKYEHCDESEISTPYNSYSSEQNLSSLSILKGGVIIRNGMNALYNLIHYVKYNDDDNVATAVSTVADDVISTNQYSEFNKTTRADELSLFYQMICDLSVKAGITPSNIYRTSRKRSRLLSFSKDPKLTTDYILHLLISYSKDPRYLDHLFQCENFDRLINWLCLISLSALNNSDNNNTSLIDKHHSSPSVNQLLFNMDQWTNESYYCSDNSSNNTDSSFAKVNNSPAVHLEYPIHLLVANFLANISQHPSSSVLNNYDDINKLISLWKVSASLHLNLFGSKIDHNLKIHSKITDGSCSDSLNSYPIYCPDVYNLNDSNDINENYDFDIIFVNGMLGSVFYTWRQHDSMLTNNPTQYTKCWPRDWLSHRFPQARIIGVDTSLKPFVWHPICPLQKLRRTLDKRAVDIMKQLKKSEVGCRPIIWITHSAGGILVKEMLRLANSVSNGTSDDSKNDHSEPITTSSTRDFAHISHTYADLSVLNGGNQTVSQSSLFKIDPSCKWYCHETDQENENLSNMSDPSFISCVEDKNANVSDKKFENRMCYSSSCSDVLSKPINNASFLTTLSDNSAIDPVNYRTLASNTQAVVFMSTPHRGNQSMHTLYRRPFRWALTPEAIQLEKDSNYLLDLHVWFNLWAYNHKVQILSMAESRVTPINRFWSVLIVPEDVKDREMGKLVRIDSDHLYISKPMNPSDLSYTSIVNFIENLSLCKQLPVNTNIKKPF